MIISAAERLSHVQEYYFAKKLREIRHREAQGENIINLGIGNPDMMPSVQTLKTLVNTAIEPGNHGYQPYKGVLKLREAFSNWYLDMYGVELEAESEVLPLIGSKEGIMHISMAFLNKGDKVLVPNPGYPTYSSVSKLMGAEIIPYELTEENQWYPDFEALEKEDLSKVKIMWVNYPHMPTGAPATMKLFDQLIDFGRRHQILICHDNPYSLVLNPKPMSLLACPEAKEVALELNSLSKSHNMAGWRVGVLAGREDYIQTVLRVKSNMDSGMFLPIQQAAIEALSNGFKWHDERNEAYRGRREQVWEILKLLGCTFQTSQTGMFIWAKIPNTSPNGEHFSEQILNGCGVFITPGFIFGTAGEQYIRISLCTPAARLEEATNRISKFQLASV